MEEGPSEASRSSSQAKGQREKGQGEVHVMKKVFLTGEPNANGQNVFLDSLFNT